MKKEKNRNQITRTGQARRKERGAGEEEED